VCIRGFKEVALDAATVKLQHPLIAMKATTRLLAWAGALAVCLPMLLGSSYPADKETIVWKTIQDAILQVDSRAPKEWNVFQAGKKSDPLLLQIGSRYLVIYVRGEKIYELKPEQLQHKGDDLLWHESDKPAKPLPTSDWSTKDVGSASRILVKLSGEGRTIDIQIPQMPDLRRGIY
jgi:hypothetical protein